MANIKLQVFELSSYMRGIMDTKSAMIRCHLEYAAINFEAVICTFVDQTISIYPHFAPFDETFQMGNFAFHPSAQYLILVHHLVYARHVRTYL